MKKTVLFDMDGVIVRTEHLKAAAHTAAVAKFGASVPDDLYADVMGQTHQDVRAAFIRAAGIPIDPKEYTEEYRRVYSAFLDTQTELVPGVRELLAGLDAAGFQLALVTSSIRPPAEYLLKKFRLDHFFKGKICAEDVQHGKPDPEPYLKALDLLSAQATGTVVLEDSRSGIIAANAAGLAVIALRHLYNQQQDFSIAFAVLDTLRDTRAVIDLIEEAIVFRHRQGEDGNH